MSASDPFFAEAAALMGDPARANILAALLDGRAWTAKELAGAAGVSAQTASGHLARLTAGRLLTVVAQGRHRYFRLASPSVAHAIEALMVLSGEATPRHRPKTRLSAELAAARTCYDHLAGSLGVGIHDALVSRGTLVVAGDGYEASPAGREFFAAMGIDTDAVRSEHRCFARPCLDWSERRTHLAGALATAFARRCTELGWIERRPGSRAVRVTAAGERDMRRLGLVACGDTPVEAA
jgi:DNA-binding transcriptional ArsR family regulator